MMYYEGLALEIYATKAGLQVIKPPRRVGASGVEHKFSFLASDGERTYAFDLYSEVGGAEVLRAFIKRLDTNISVFLVCLRGKPSEEAVALAEERDVRVMAPSEIETFFESEVVVNNDSQGEH